MDSAADAGVRVFVTGRSAVQLGPVTSDVDFGTVAYFDPWESP